MMEADVTTTITDWSAVLTYQGAMVTGTWSPLTIGDTLEADGLIQASGGEFVAPLTSFTTIPPQRAVVDIDGTKYFVESSTTDPACVSLRVSRADDNTHTQGIR